MAERLKKSHIEPERHFQKEMELVVQECMQNIHRAMRRYQSDVESAFEAVKSGVVNHGSNTTH